MNSTELSYKSASELTSLLQAREVSAVELAQAAIARIEQHDAQINAVCVRDFERALSAAGDADAALAQGMGDTRPLLGIPMTVKDSFNIAGLPTTWGMPWAKDFRPNEDAIAVARIKAAGAVVLGKTNVPFALGDLQTYNEIYGTTSNPWNLERTPGGSSGGSAAALAAGFGALSIGSDIAGSLRVPAHFCGIYAHKPTFGILPSRGHVPPGVPALPMERDLSVIGPMARSAFDLSLLFNVLSASGGAPASAVEFKLPVPRHQELKGFRVLIRETHPLVPTGEATRLAIARLAGQLAAAGARVEYESAVAPDAAAAARLYMRLLFASMASNWPPAVYEQSLQQAAKLDAADVSLAAERIRGSVLTHRDWLAADMARHKLRQSWQELFKDFDAVISPVSPTPAFAHDQSPDQFRRTLDVDGTSILYADQLAWASEATTPGLPATSIPIGTSADGLPIGVQIIGPMYGDRTTLKLAELLEMELGAFRPPKQFC